MDKNPIEALAQIARDSAKEELHGVLTANAVLMTEMLRLLMAKNILSADEARDRLTIIDQAAVTMGSSSIAFKYLSETTLIIRHALSLDHGTPGSKPS